MPAILLFILTTLAYIAMAFINLQKTPARGEYLMVSGFMMFGLIAVYVITSLLLTISVASRGGFDWLSPTPSTR
ncbi:MAG: hypothetical protein IPN60_20980, partial [Saprospiraceae bacterium]|nr:hypothetical protein [Candidatus Opimibacter skivensis]